MKNFIYSILLMASLSVGAQSTFRVFKHNTTVSVTPNALYEVTTIPADLTTSTFDFLNISTSTHTYNVKRYDLILHTITSSDKAEARFCVASQCYGAGDVTALFPLVLPAGVNTATLGNFQSLDCDLVDASVIGYSLVKYTLFNINQPSDSIQFTLRYNYATRFASIKEDAGNLQTMQILPNPAKQFATLNVFAGTSAETQVVLINSIGQKVLEQQISLNSGKNLITLNLSQLPSGVYFAQLSDGKNLSTRKLIIE